PQGKPDNDNVFPWFQRIPCAKMQWLAYRSGRLNNCNIIAGIDRLDSAITDIGDADTFAAIDHMKIGDNRTAVADGKPRPRLDGVGDRRIRAAQPGQNQQYSDPPRPHSAHV